VKKKFNFSSGFISKTIELTEGIISSSQFELFIESIEREAAIFHFDNTSESNLLRVINSVYDKKSFINDLIRYKHHPEILIYLTANSNYLTDIVVRNPEYLYQLFDQEYLLRELTKELLQNEIENSLNRYRSFNAKLNYLKQTKKRFILKIGVSDILKMIDLTATTRQLSILSRVLTSQLFRICYEEIEQKYSLQLDKNKFCLCSLGKLGGNELNYSSDIDLLLFYDKNEFYGNINKEYHELLSEAALLFIKSASEITDIGYIYRVDFRLRPDGKYSPLCKSLVDYTKYYETRGEDWERQMLIKLDYISGGESLYNDFHNFLQPYIYPHSFSHSLKEQIQKIKKKIEIGNRDKENVKLFKGGIRDIEFSVQALQLINGGRLKKLRTGNTLEAIRILNENKLLNNKETKIFTEAYHFYRKIEHFLQLMNDTQTHLIPEEGDLLKKLSLFLNFKTVADFKLKLTRYRKDVRNIFESILYAKDKDELPIEGIHFRDRSRALKNWNYLSSGAGVFGQKEFDQRTITLFEQISSDLAAYLKKSSSPDKTLDNLVKIVRSVTLTSIWYSELCDKIFLKNILTLCEFSDKAINLIVMDKSCSEILLTRKIFKVISLEDITGWTYNQVIFYLSARFALGLFNSQDVSEIIAEYILKRIEELINNANIKLNYFIAGLGSLSSSTLSFASDIDLVIVAGSEKEAVEEEKSYMRIINLLMDSLKPIATDFRLRPEGKTSQLIWSIDKFNDYIKTRARVWELEAFSKLKFIYGNHDLFNSLKETVLETSGNFSPEMIISEIKMMDKKIKTELMSFSDSSFNVKKQTGGLATIDFIIDSLILTDRELLTTGFGIKRIELLRLLSKGEIRDDIKILAKNFRTLKLIELAIQNIFDVANSIIPKNEEKRAALSTWLKLKHRILLDEQLNYVIKTNNELFKKYVG